MSEAPQTVRQSRVLWWLMHGGLVLAFILPMLLLMFGALSALGFWSDYDLSLRMGIAWGIGWSLIASVGITLAVHWFWGRFVAPRETENERRRYRALSKNEDTLPASAWADEVEE